MTGQYESVRARRYLSEGEIRVVVLPKGNISLALSSSFKNIKLYSPSSMRSLIEYKVFLNDKIRVF